MHDILHVIPDNKFTRNIVAGAEHVAPGRNRYIAISADASHLHESLLEPMLERVSESDAMRIARATQWRLVVFHSLPANRYRMLRVIGSQAMVLWRIWGYEIYGHLLRGDHYFPPDFLEPETRRLAAEGRKTLRSHLQPLRRVQRRTEARVALRRVDLVAPVLPVEGHVLLRQNRWFQSALTEWAYRRSSAIEMDSQSQILPIGVRPEQTFGILGHSGDPKNNHLDAAVQMSQSGLWESVERVLVPVSYGPMSYIEQLRERLPEIVPNAVFLDEFMEAARYANLLSTAAFIVHYGLRQIGMGNITNAILGETPLVLNPRGMVKRHFDEVGYSSSSPDEIVATAQIASMPEGLRANKMLHEQRRLHTFRTMEETIARL